MRRGIAELDGEGEVVGGIVIMRSGRNALTTIAAVKAKLASLKAGLPAGVEIVPAYDRSDLIKRAVSNLSEKLVEEFVVVALVCFAFLFHLRSALVAGGRAPARRARRVRRDACAGHQRQHHVARRHRDRHRRHGGRGDRDD
jgi:Cu/Ag efflux pump CusA